MKEIDAKVSYKAEEGGRKVTITIKADSALTLSTLADCLEELLVQLDSRLNKEPHDTEN